MKKSRHYNLNLQEGSDDIDIGGISDNFEALDGIAHAIREDSNSHTADKSNPHGVTKAQIGLGNVTNTEQAAKTDFNAHTADKSNPHNVTKSQVGLGNVTNTEQASKADFDAHKADFDAHTSNKSNPHGVTKSQIGLGNVTNTEQAAKTDFNNHTANKSNPHSVTKAQIGLGNVTDTEQAAKADFDAHTSNKSNPHGVTKSQIGLGNVTNTEQASKTDFNNHTANKSNPHSVTKSQIGLGNVANTEQASKADFDTHTANKSNPHGVTKAQVGLGNVTNNEQATKTEFNTLSGRVTVLEKNQVFYGTCSTTYGQAAKVIACSNFKSTDLVSGTRIAISFDTGNTSNYMTLNVNGTGAVTAWFPVGSGRLYNDPLISKIIVTGCVYEFVYQTSTSTGNKWVYCGATNIPANGSVSYERLDESLKGKIDKIGNTRTATVVVAASNSKNKSSADFVCTGSNDQTTIQKAIDYCSYGGKIVLLEGDYRISGSINLEYTRIIFEGMSTYYTLLNFTKDGRFTANYADIAFRDLSIDAADVKTHLIGGSNITLLFDNSEVSVFAAEDCTTDVFTAFYGIIKASFSNSGLSVASRASGNGCYSLIELTGGTYVNIPSVNFVNCNITLNGSKNRVHLSREKANISNCNITVTGGKDSNNKAILGGTGVMISNSYIWIKSGNAVSPFEKSIFMNNTRICNEGEFFNMTPPYSTIVGCRYHGCAVTSTASNNRYFAGNLQYGD